VAPKAALELSGPACKPGDFSKTSQDFREKPVF